MILMNLQRILAEVGIGAIGLFLIADSLWLHSITFDYAKYGLKAFDPVIDHWMIGLFLIVLVALDWTAE